MATVYLDTNVFIRCFEFLGDQALPLETLFLALRDRPGAAVTSELTIPELLSPTKRSDASDLTWRRDLYSNLLLSSNFVRLECVSLSILLATPELRAAYGHKLPDATQIATAQRSGCSLFMSGDDDLSRLPSSLQCLRPDQEGGRVCLERLARRTSTP